MEIRDIDPQDSPHDRHIPSTYIDRALAAQIIVAWAGEGGESPRLGWWRSDLISEFGGEDLFKRLLPHTWDWAVFQGSREAARRTDAAIRSRDHDPDQIVSLYSFGFEIDERIEDRLQDLKRSEQTPREALPALGEAMKEPWDRDGFLRWLGQHGEVETKTTPVGRQVRGALPQTLDAAVTLLVAGLSPLSEEYPLPHFRRAS